MTLPKFMIIGASRCGTTSMHNYLGRHPEITLPRTKESLWFNFHYERFPYEKCFRDGAITFDATPSYFSDKTIPFKIYKTMPNDGQDLKFILILRDPIERAYSHWKHHFQDRATNQSFENILAKPPHPFYDFINRGMYAEHLKNWYKWFNHKQFLILDYRNFIKETGKVMKVVHNFIGVKKINDGNYIKYNGSKIKAPMLSKTRSVLEDIFKEPNKEIFKLTGLRF